RRAQVESGNRNYRRQRLVFHARIRSRGGGRNRYALWTALGQLRPRDAGGTQGSVPGPARARTPDISVGAEFPGKYLRHEIAGGTAYHFAERGRLSQRGASP